MKLSAIIRVLIAAKATPESILLAVETYEIEQSNALENRRESDRKRQAKSREKSDCHVTSRDITGHVSSHVGASRAGSNTLSSVSKDTSEVKKERIDARAIASHVTSDLEQFKSILSENGVTDADIGEFIKLRKAKKGAITAKSAMLFVQSAADCEITVSKAIDHCISRNWLTVKPEWLANGAGRGAVSRFDPPPKPPTKAKNAFDLASRILNGTVNELDFDTTRSFAENHETRFDDGYGLTRFTAIPN